MNKMLCVSLTERTSSKCNEFMQACEADMIEHRMDFMDRIKDLDVIYASSERPIIATCRSVASGGNFRGDEPRRIDYLLDALDAGASYVDVELETAPSLMSLVQERIGETNLRLIVSKHFQESTPSLSELVNTLNGMEEVGADIAKIVITPHTITDCCTILQLYSIEPGCNLPLISFAMGALGKFTRVCALFLGAPFMYVAQDSGAVAASGQIPLTMMRVILEVLQ